jgi:hypothetical protein
VKARFDKEMKLGCGKYGLRNANLWSTIDPSTGQMLLHRWATSGPGLPLPPHLVSIYGSEQYKQWAEVMHSLTRLLIMTL